MVGRDDAVLAKSSSLWFVRDFRWRDAGPRTREKLPRHPLPRIPTPFPASPCAHRPHCAFARLQLLEVGGRDPRAPGVHGPRSPRGAIGMDRSAFKFAGNGRIHFKRRGRNVDSRGALGWWGSLRSGHYTLSGVEVRSLSGSQVPPIVAVPVGETYREGVGLGCKRHCRPGSAPRVLGLGLRSPPETVSKIPRQQRT